MYERHNYQSWQKFCRRYMLLAFFSAFLGGWVQAATVPPTAGSVIQEVPQLPTLPRWSVPELRIQYGEVLESAKDGAKVEIPVSFLQLVGNTVLSESELLAASGFKPGLLTLKDLRTAAGAVASYYHQHGYVLAQVMVPAQEIDANGGPVKLLVLEGQFGAIKLNNASSLGDKWVLNLLEGGAKPGQVVSAQTLERSLLLLSDVPGVQVQSTLMPGAEVGTSDLQMEVSPGRAFSGSIDADNEGNTYTGASRMGATLNVNNPAGHGDLLSLRAFGSESGLLQYARFDYRQPVSQGKVGLALTHMNYSLGGIYHDLAASGVGDIATLYWTYPLVRTRKSNINAQWSLDDKHFSDQQSASATSSDKTTQVVGFTMSGDWQDDWGLGATSSFAVTGSAGTLNLRSAASKAADFSTANTNGDYAKLVYSASRLQRINEVLGLFVSANGQLADKNLDISEKIELGGANGVRSYPEGEAYGDQGAVASIELRWNLPRWSLFAQDPQLIVFADAGEVTINRNNWTSDSNSRSLGAFGLGLNLLADRNFQLKLFWACKTGSSAATSSSDANSRTWLQFVKYL